MDKIETLRLAALLHDIGRFQQRTSNVQDKNHFELGKDFAEKSGLDGIPDLILNHHGPNKSKNKKLAEILQKAGSLSAGKEIDNEDSSEVQGEPLRSFFPKIDIGKEDNYDSKDKEWYYPLAILKSEKESVFPIKNKIEKNTSAQYERMWKGFLREFSMIPKGDSLSFTTLYYLLQRYTSYMPLGASQSLLDISLFDHLKTTAAIADCLYKITGEEDGKEDFLLLGGDISGIQKFIYNIFSPEKAQKGMAKRLRGRSFYISLLTESLAHYFLDTLELSCANLLWCGGGKFQILVPNTKEFKSKIEKAKEKINKMLLERFQGRLYLAVAYAEGDIKDFSATSEEVAYNLSVEKNKKFSNMLGSIFNIQPSEKVCPICGDDFSNSNNEDFCGKCIKQEYIGETLPKAEYLMKVNGKDLTYEFDVCFSEIGIYWHLVKDEKEVVSILKSLESEKDKIDSIVVYSLNNTDFLTQEISKCMKDSTLPISLAFKFIGKTVPLDKKGNVKSFEEIAKLSVGSKLIGILRMDVDDLGAILSLGLKKIGKEKTILRLITLSRLLDIFFSGYLNEICKKYKSEDGYSKLYITYAGGDDAFIVGPWDTIMEVAKDIHNEFSAYTCMNPNITISCGIFQCKPKFPIGSAANIAGEKIEMAKKYGKDSVTVFEETVRWETEKHADRWNGYDKLLEYAKKLEEYSEEGKISRSFVYSILGFWRETFYENKKKNGFTSLDIGKQKKRYMPHFKYLLSRNIDKNKYSDLFKDLDTNIPKIVPWAEIPVSWVSLRTRGDKK